MSRYRRIDASGGSFFFTVNLANRQSRLLVEHIERLRNAYGKVQQSHPFETVAICVLPNHLHAIWQLPQNDSDYSQRWSLIKKHFQAHYLPTPIAVPAKSSNAKKASGNADFGSTIFAMKPIWPTTHPVRALQPRQTRLSPRPQRLAIFQLPPLVKKTRRFVGWRSVAAHASCRSEMRRCKGLLKRAIGCFGVTPFAWAGNLPTLPR
ncbi:REP-associated tyrosine transposase [Lampropedia aestuarii]|uniref:REP-associated tyrosine transposase n=1 Tax=Lampropedia aestuarii TaxID=2562762 RepID=UPI002468EBC8|nr:hypothetical protein [Lampropedia aestuarii]MDH5858167.1 hypothetical protein [Lampropedia aestuarii]